MTIKDLKKKIENYHDDMPIVIIPEFDDMEESQVVMTEEMWGRVRTKNKNGGSKSVAILCIPFS